MNKQKVVDLINRQINRELFSAYLYLDMSAFANDLGLTGFTHWMKIQAAEERDHALYFVEFLQHIGATVTYEALAKPERSYADVGQMLKTQLQHEQFVTASIGEILTAALEAKDFLTQEFLQWFIREQGEEEKNATDLILRYENFAKNPGGLFILDQSLLQRVYKKSTPDLD